MEKETKYFVRYKINPKSAIPFQYRLGYGTQTFTMQCHDKRDAMRQGYVIDYGNVRYLRIFSKTYVKVLNINILIKKTILFSTDIKLNKKCLSLKNPNELKKINKLIEDIEKIKIGNETDK